MVQPDQPRSPSIAGRHRLPLALMLVGVCGLSAAHAEVYRGSSDGGVPEFTDRPRDGFELYLENGEHQERRAAARSPAQSVAAGDRGHAARIDQVARENGLAPELLHAVVQIESGYDAGAVSAKGAVGLMQLMPATARRFGVPDRRDPLANLRGGARYLRSLLDLFGDLPVALAAYNAGEAAVLRHAGGIPPYPETIAYVRAVQRRYAQLAGARQ